MSNLNQQLIDRKYCLACQTELAATHGNWWICKNTCCTIGRSNYFRVRMKEYVIKRTEIDGVATIEVYYFDTHSILHLPLTEINDLQHLLHKIEVYGALL